MSVFVLSREGKPVMPCTEKRARKLLASGRARVHRMFPFAIRLVDRTMASCELQPLRLSLDPGSKVTGLALSRVEENPGGDPVMYISFLMEMVHRGQAIRRALLGRAQLRGGRRTGSFNIQTSSGVVEGVSHRYCKVTMRGDGYSYHHIAEP
jgi:hypothetical protein